MLLFLLYWKTFQICFFINIASRISLFLSLYSSLLFMLGVSFMNCQLKITAKLILVSLMNNHKYSELWCLNCINKKLNIYDTFKQKFHLFLWSKKGYNYSESSSRKKNQNIYQSYFRFMTLFKIYILLCCEKIIVTYLAGIHAIDILKLIWSIRKTDDMIDMSRQFLLIFN